jgi:hypothetical protein
MFRNLAKRRDDAYSDFCDGKMRGEGKMPLLAPTKSKPRRLCLRGLLFCSMWNNETGVQYILEFFTTKRKGSEMKLTQTFWMGARLSGSIVVSVLNQTANMGSQKRWALSIQKIEDSNGKEVGDEVKIIRCRRILKRVLPRISINILEPIFLDHGYQFLEVELVTNAFWKFLHRKNLHEELKKIGEQLTQAFSHCPKRYHVFESKTTVIPK